MALNLGMKEVVDNGQGNTLIYTALIAGALANMLPTPMDSVYFMRVNKLERDFDDGKISASKLEWHVAGEYYLWTTLWYAALFTGIYAFKGKYKNNARFLLAALASGLVVGAVLKNVEVDEAIQKRKRDEAAGIKATAASTAATTTTSTTDVAPIKQNFI